MLSLMLLLKTKKMTRVTLERYSKGFIIEAAPKRVGESRVLINSVEDIKALGNLIHLLL